MDTIIISILFAVPGVIVGHIKKRLFPKLETEVSDYEKTIQVLIHSLGVLVINIFILSHLYESPEILTFNGLQEKLMGTSFFFYYALMSVGSSIIYVILLEVILKNVLYYVIKAYRNKRKLPLETKFNTVWEEIFENPNNSVDNMYVSIEKEGIRVTQGVLKSYSPPNSEQRELLLCYSNEIKEYMERDEELPDDEKFFGTVTAEYYDTERDYLIKIYDNTKLVSYLEGDSSK